MRVCPAIAVIADDFTGACDTGAQLAHPANPCPVLLADTPTPDSLFCDAISRSGRVVCDTESRNIAPEVAAARVANLGHSIAGIGSTGGRKVELIYKKIDSTLRGNISAELSALHTAFPERVLLIAPAFPAVGRTTVGGRCMVDGIPVHLTEYGRDALSPVHSSQIAALLPANFGSVLCNERDLATILPNLGPGDAVIVDAQSEAELRTIVTAAANHMTRLVMVGSAGLAAALSSELPSLQAAGSVPVRGVERQVVLGLVGSLSESSRRQAALLTKQARVVGIELGAAGAGAVIGKVLGALSDGNDVVVLTPPLAPRTAGDRSSREELSTELATEFARALGKIARRAVERVGQLGLFVTGGDCAVATIHAIGGDVIHVYSEVHPGVPLIGIGGTEWGEVRAVTKAGGFGAEDIMVKSFDYLRGQR